MSGREQAYRCCACCEGIAKDDHVEHGGTVEKDGHDVPCLTCGSIADESVPWLAPGDNPYRTPPADSP